MKSEGLNTIARAADFAARRHCEQRRKGAAREPYINHLIEVGALLAEATHDPVLIAAGYLHDTLEDTETEIEELQSLFGAEIANLVAEVTDDKSLPKLQRKRLQIERAPSKTAGARLIKIADKTSNLRAIANSPPVDWGSGRAIEYVEWAERVVAGCRGLSQKLEEKFDDAANHARAIIAGRER